MKREKIQAVIFDLGGTLVDTQRALLAAMCGAIDEVGLPCPPEARVRANLGWHEPLLMRGLVPKEHEARATRAMLARLGPELEGAGPIEGAEAALLRLRERGLRLAVASGFARGTLDGILSRLGWEHLFEATVSADDITRPRPAPDLLLEAARRLNLPPAECLAVGDSLYDVEAAGACAMAFAGVLTGAQAAELAARLPEGAALASVAELPGSPLLAD